MASLSEHEIYTRLDLDRYHQRHPIPRDVHHMVVVIDGKHISEEALEEALHAADIALFRELALYDGELQSHTNTSRGSSGLVSWWWLIVVHGTPEQRELIAMTRMKPGVVSDSD